MREEGQLWVISASCLIQNPVDDSEIPTGVVQEACKKRIAWLLEVGSVEYGTVPSPKWRLVVDLLTHFFGIGKTT